MLNEATFPVVNVARRAARAAALACCWIVVELTAPPALAQSIDPEPTSGPASQPAALHLREQAVAERVQRLEGRMLQLAKLLAETEPEQAERLRDALARVGKERIKHRVEQVVALLRSQRFSDAEREQQTLMPDLESILTALTNPADDVARRRQERERLEAHKRAVRSLMDDQTQQIYRTEQARAAQAAAEELAQQAAALEEIAKRQSDLRADAKKPESRGEQEKLERNAREAAASLERLAESLGEQSAADAARGAARDTQGAAQAMKQAFQRMSTEAAPDTGAQAAGTSAAQQQAEENLRRAVRRLREERGRQEQAAALRDIERAQRQAQQKGADLQKQMQPQSEGAAPAPGTPQVGKAVENMQRAADRLGERQPTEAREQQKESLDQLQEALDELDDALRQMRREEVEETLTVLEARFKSLLAREEDVRDAVVGLHKKRDVAWGRSEDLRLAEVSQSQRKIAEDCAAVLRILTDEGTTVVLPELVRQISTDMHAVAGRLEGSDTADETQHAIAAIIAALQEITGAIESKRADDQQNSEQSEDGEQGQQRSPLLPGSAELKLLRASQIRVRERTAQIQPAPTATPEQQALYSQLAARQRELADLARRMGEAK